MACFWDWLPTWSYPVHAGLNTARGAHRGTSRISPAAVLLFSHIGSLKNANVTAVTALPNSWAYSYTVYRCRCSAVGSPLRRDGTGFGPAPQPMSRTRHPESRSQSSVDFVGTPKAQQRAGFPRNYLYAFIGYSLLVTLVAVFMLYGEYQEQLGYWHEKLTRVADVNRRLLESWVKERSEDAGLLASFPCTTIAGLSEPGPTPAHQWLWQK